MSTSESKMPSASNEFAFFRHPQALVETTQIGERSKIWAFAHVLSGAVIGNDVNVCDHVFIENDVVVGDRVTIKCGVQLWDGLRVEDDVFIGPNVTFTNDPFPRSKVRPQTFAPTRICTGASLGANSTILPGITIGAHAMVGAGSVVTRDVPVNAIVVGNPARITGYVDSDSIGIGTAVAGALGPDRAPRMLSTRGAALCVLPQIVDLRGALTFGEIEAHLPFTPQRFFVVYDVPSSEVRGEHAHKTLHQFLVCVKGSCHVMLDDGNIREEVRLDSPTIGLHLPPRVWSVQYKYSADAILLVLASDVYEADDYILDYAGFISFIGKV